MPNYRCNIAYKDKQIANLQFNLNNNDKKSDEKATKMMDEFLKIVATSNFIQPRDCNVNLYREEWVEGI